MASPREQRIQTYKSMDPADESLAFHQLLDVHLCHGSGNSSAGQPWKDADFGDKLVSVKSLGNWRAQRRRPPDEALFNLVLIKFGLQVRPSGEDNRTPAQVGHERVFRAAWARAYYGLPATTEPGLASAGGKFTFPANLPARLTQRRALIRQAVQAILDAGTNAMRTGPLDPLKSRWPEHVLADPEEDADTEPMQRFVHLTIGLTECKEVDPPWEAAKAGANAALRDRRQRDCMHIAMLLSALAWT